MNIEKIFEPLFWMKTVHKSVHRSVHPFNLGTNRIITID
jgi:hypothetical protein